MGVDYGMFGEYFYTKILEHRSVFLNDGAAGRHNLTRIISWETPERYRNTYLMKIYQERHIRDKGIT